MVSLEEVKLAVHCLLWCVHCRRQLAWTVLLCFLAYNILCTSFTQLGPYASGSARYLASFLSPRGLAAITIVVVMRIMSKIKERRAHDEFEADTEELERAVKEKSKRFEGAYASDTITHNHRPRYATERHDDLDERDVPGDGPLEEFNSQNPSAASDQDDLECPICREDYDVGQKVVTLPCSHRFHGECLKRHHESSLTCPRCTRKLGWTFCFADDDDDDGDEADIAEDGEFAAAGAADEDMVERGDVEDTGVEVGGHEEAAEVDSG